MSTVRATQRLTVEDFPEQKGWIGKLISPINDYITQSIKILNQGMIFADNVLGKDHLFDFVYQSDAISLPIGFLWTLGSQPRALVIVSALEDEQPVNLSASWQITVDSQVRLVGIVKFTSAPAVALLSAGSRYKIRVRVTP